MSMLAGMESGAEKAKRIRAERRAAQTEKEVAAKELAKHRVAEFSGAQ